VTDPPAQLRVWVNAPERVRLGSIVPIVIGVENTGEVALPLYLRGRTIAFDILIADESGGVLELSDEWDQHTNRGKAVPPGLYTAQGIVLTDRPEPLASLPQPLLIVSV